MFPRVRKLMVGCLVVGTCMMGWVCPAGALFGIGDTVVDIQALIQRLTQFTATIAQIRAIVHAGAESLQMFQAAYEGVKNWRNLGWIDTLDLVNLPWFDGVDGIDDIRRLVFAGSMAADQAGSLFADLKGFDQYVSNPRYQNDAWFRAKVRSLLRQSRRAQAVRLALMRQIDAQNSALTKDLARMKRLTSDIEDANSAKLKGQPVDQAKVASLSAELQALEAKHQGEDIMLANQRVLMGVAGEDDAHKAFMDMFTERSWQTENAARLRNFGKGFAR